MTVVKNPVIKLATAEHVVELKKELRNERAAARTDVTRKCKLQLLFIVQPTWQFIFFDSFEALLFCNCLRIIMFFNSVKSCEVKSVKLITTWSQGYTANLLQTFKDPNQRGQAGGMYVKILVCNKCWKNSTSTTASSPMSSIFQENLVFLPTFFCPGTTFNSLNFQRTYLIAIIV